MKLSDYNWDLLPIHTVIGVRFELSERDMELMWRGYGRFTNLTTGSEWFVAESTSDIKHIVVPSFRLP